jgi:protein prenyltransferase alpha subunit repeat containing protein 1
MARDDASMPPEVAERLALELDAALAADPLVDELAFLPSASPADVFGPNEATHPPGTVTSSASPGAFTLVEHKLALSARALVPLHAFASAAFRRARDAERAREEAPVGVDPDTGADAIRLLLVVNGDHATAWNARKRRALASLASIRPEDDATRRALADAELRFAEMVLSKFPKAQSCWAHRRWTLAHVSRVASSDGTENRADDRSDARAAIFAEESRVAELAATRKRLNYAAWAHRRWCARGHSGWGEPDGDVAPFRGFLDRTGVETELKRAADRARRNVSDYCGLHYRQALMRDDANATNAPSASSRVRDRRRDWDWASESAFVGELIERYPGREALWAHRRFVFHGWCEAASREGASVAAPSVDDERTFARRMTENAGETPTTTWAERPAAEQARFAAAHDVWTLEVARRFGRETTQAVTVGARGDALDALERWWPWGRAATAGMRETALGGGGDELELARDDARR